MPYIGKTTDGFGVRNRFVYLASSGATSVSGADANGATLTFTDGAYVDVYLNGVLLKPTTDYNTSTANTIAGLSALNTNDEVTVVVYDIFTVADMVSATSGGTFVGNVNFSGNIDVDGTANLDVVDIDGAVDMASTLSVTGTTKLGEIASIGQATPLSPNDATSFLHIGDNNNQDTSIILEDAVEIWEIYQNDTLSFRKDTTIVQELHRDGYVTQPLQPAFNASNITVTQSNIAINTDVTVVFGTERFDNNGDFTSNIFTAPVTGRYQLNTMIRFGSLDTAAGYYALFIDTSNRRYLNILDPNGFSQDLDYYTLSLSVVADMDANDTAKIIIHQSGGTAQTDLDSGTGSCHFSGCLLA
jgi:hypothetical protein